MNKVFLLFLSFWMMRALPAQDIGDYQMVVEDATFDGLPGVHSFAAAQYDNKWLIIGGRTDGRHRRQPWASFWEQDNNKPIFVIHPVERQVWPADLSGLPLSIYEQLQSANMSFEQKGETLYIIGGYGYAASANKKRPPKGERLNTFMGLI